MTEDAGRRLAEAEFPNGPEEIAKAIGAIVRREPMRAKLGWCVQARGRVIIRINDAEPLGRQRFTLAHELAHVLQGTPPDVLTRGRSLFSSLDVAEREADRLAADLLLPTTKLASLIGPAPLSRKSISRIVKVARVTPTMAAARIAHLAGDLGHGSAIVIKYDEDNKYKWSYSPTMKVGAEKCEDLLRRVSGVSGGLLRAPRTDGKVLAAFLLEQTFHPTVFAQVLPADIGNQKTIAERQSELRAELFPAGSTHQNSFGACIGDFRRKLNMDRTSGDPVGLFLAEYKHKAWFKYLNTPKGREYIRTYLPS